MAQEDLIDLEGSLVTKSSFDHVNNVQGVVLQRVSGVGADALVVPVDFVHGRVGLLGHHGRRSNNHVSSVVCEQGTFPEEEQVAKLGRDRCCLRIFNNLIKVISISE